MSASPILWIVCLRGLDVCFAGHMIASPCVEVELEERRKAPQPNKGRGVNLRCGKRGEWGDRTTVHGSTTHSNLVTDEGSQRLGIQVFALDYVLYMY